MHDYYVHILILDLSSPSQRQIAMQVASIEDNYESAVAFYLNPALQNIRGHFK